MTPLTSQFRSTDPELNDFIFNSNLACAKRTAVERRGIHAWHPYYAGYSEAFVESALGYLGATRKSRVLDPWGGSGTTAIVSARNGINCLTVDINPVMATFAAAKSKEILENEIAIKDFLNSLSAGEISTFSHAPPSEVYDTETQNILSQVLVKADSFSDEIKRSSKYKRNKSPSEKTVKKSQLILSPERSFILAVLFVSLRNLMGHIRLTNPTWIRRDRSLLSIEAEVLTTQLKQSADTMLTELRSFYARSENIGEVASMIGDARDIPIKSDSIDHIITSPPYLTRIDYAVSTLPELDLLGGSELIHQIRHKTTGAPVITRSPKIEDENWGAKCVEILKRVRNHGTQAAAGYYWKNMIQYFTDIYSSLNEIKRVLRIGGNALLVVQSSYFKDIEIPLTEIFLEMAENVGLDSSIASRQIVRGHMAHKNKRSNIYKNNKVYFEDAILLTKRTN